MEHALAQQRLNRISRHVYWLSPDSATDRPVLGAVAGARSTLVVDAGNSPAHAQLLLRELAERDVAPPAFVVLTHWHWDHVFGTSVLDLPTLAHVETRRIVRLMSELDWNDAALDQRVADGVEHYLDAHNTQPISKAELVGETALLKAIGGTVESLGQDRTAVLSKLPDVLGTPIKDDHDVDKQHTRRPARQYIRRA